MAYICWEGHLVHCLVGPGRERRQSGTSCPLWGAACLGRAISSMPVEDAWGAAVAALPSAHQWESWSRSRRREDPHDEALQEAREAHQWALEVAHVLEHDIEKLSWGVEDAWYPWPCSHSSSHPQSKSLDRHQRSPSRHRLERWVTFHEPELEPDSSERTYRGPWGHAPGRRQWDSPLPKGRRWYVPRRCL